MSGNAITLYLLFCLPVISCGRIGMEHLEVDGSVIIDGDTDTATAVPTIPGTAAMPNTDTNSGTDDGTFDTALQWVPDALPGLALWLDADDPGSVVFDVGIAEWRDRSGNNRHAVQSDPDAQPALSADGIGGRPAVEFDGTADFLVVAAYPSLTDYDAFLVWESPDPPPTDRLTAMVRYGAVDFATNIEITHGHDMEPFRHAATFSMDGEYLVAKFDPPEINTGYLWNMSFDSVLGRLFSRTNGHNSNQFGDFPGPPDAEGSGLGIGARVNGIQQFHGKIGELIIYDRVLSDPDRVQVETYLQSKWRWDKS